MPAVTVLAGQQFSISDLVQGLESCGVVVLLSVDRPYGRSLLSPVNAAIERVEGDEYQEVELVEHPVELEGERKYVAIYIYRKVLTYSCSETMGFVERAVATWHKRGKPNAYGWSALR